MPPTLVVSYCSSASLFYVFLIEGGADECKRYLEIETGEKKPQCIQPALFPGYS